MMQTIICTMETSFIHFDNTIVILIIEKKCKWYYYSGTPCETPTTTAGLFICQPLYSSQYKLQNVSQRELCQV